MSDSVEKDVLCQTECGWRHLNIQACAQDGRDCRLMDGTRPIPPEEG